MIVGVPKESVAGERRVALVPELVPKLRQAGLEVWIVDALRYTPHPSHLSVDDALSWIERLQRADTTFMPLSLKTMGRERS